MKGVEDRPDNTAKWAQDSDAWEAFGGMTVTQRMDRLKAVLKEAQEALGQDGAAPEEVMNAMVEALHEALPADRRPKLPWSALINLINAGIGKVGWTFNGRKKQDDEAGPAYTADEYGAALKAAVDGLGQWLPNNAVNHQALPTVSPAQAAAEELPLSQYQAMWPIEYPDEPVLRVITDDFPRRPYKMRSEEKTGKGRGFQKRDVHWGQRKLFMNEIELLTLHGKPGDVVVYAGAAPGTHLRHLAQKLFPEIKFVLVDPAPFTVQANEQISLRQELMTDELALEFAGRGNVIFVSDIRRTYASEDLIKEDMSDQQRWHDLIRPKVSMLKFRLPWLPGDTEYLVGKVYTQPYAKPRSTEMRLIAEGHERKTWSNREYEEQCFFFNTIVRETRHNHDVIGAALDSTWDCGAEVEILRDYLSSRKAGFGQLTREEQNEEVALLSACITIEIGGEQGRQWMNRMDRDLLRRAKVCVNGDVGEMREKDRRDSWKEDKDGRWAKGGSPPRKPDRHRGRSPPKKQPEAPRQPPPAHHHDRHDRNGHDRHSRPPPSHQERDRRPSWGNRSEGRRDEDRGRQDERARKRAREIEQDRYVPRDEQQEDDERKRRRRSRSRDGRRDRDRARDDGVRPMEVDGGRGREERSRRDSGGRENRREREREDGTEAMEEDGWGRDDRTKRGREEEGAKGKKEETKAKAVEEEDDEEEEEVFF